MRSSSSPTFTLQLPYPDRTLSPNCPKRHWRSKQLAKEQARESAQLLSYSQRGVFENVNVLQMRLTIYPPDKKRRDLDNVLTAMKSAIDGVCKGLEIDDSQIRRVMLEWGSVVKNGVVELQLNVYGVSYQ